MERLTKIENGVPVYVGPECESIGGSIAAEMSTSQTREVLFRLAAYEDTGLMPVEVTALQRDWSDLCTVVGECCGIDHLRELAKADKDGRTLILPCKVGDTVYFVIKDSPCFYPETNGWYIGESKVLTVTDRGFCDGEVGVDVITTWDDLGRTVFLTREEAEAALKEASHEV